jgi:hypothetical protein
MDTDNFEVMEAAEKEWIERNKKQMKDTDAPLKVLRVYMEQNSYDIDMVDEMLDGRTLTPIMNMRVLPRWRKVNANTSESLAMRWELWRQGDVQIMTNLCFDYLYNPPLMIGAALVKWPKYFFLLITMKLASLVEIALLIIYH